MEYVWNKYETYAYGADGLDPVSGSAGQHSLQIFLIDSLDTLYLMDMKDEFYKARDYVLLYVYNRLKKILILEKVDQNQYHYLKQLFVY